MKTLDRSKSFGMICGNMAECPRARFMQDGLYFDANGNRIATQAEINQEEIDKFEEPETESVWGEREVLALHNGGKSAAEIRKITGLHHKTIAKMLSADD